MNSPHIAGASERLNVAVAAHGSDYGAVRTDFRVDRWDEHQTRWALNKIEREGRSLRTLLCQPDRHGKAEPTGKFFRQFGILPYATSIHENCNLVVQAGWVALLGGVAGTSITTKFSATAGRIGIGTSSTAAAYSNTALGGDTGGSSTTSYYQLVSGAPTISTGSSPPTLVFTSSFGTGVANFAWAEFGTDNGATSSVTTTGGAAAVFFNHGISSQGTKASGQTWTATETISFGFPSGSGTVS